MFPDAEIEHIGSTSVSGALTKGDVDLLVQVNAHAFEAAVRSCRQIYEVNQPENWTPTFASFKDDTSFELPLGVQLAVKGADTYAFVALRDRLNSDLIALEGYNAIKRAHHGGDETRYRDAKGEFIERLLASIKTEAAKPA